MIRLKTPFFLVVLLLLLVLSACNPKASAKEQPDLQATLGAMYAEETAQAVQAAPQA
jgi:hypothetical protein